MYLCDSSLWVQMFSLWPTSFGDSWGGTRGAGVTCSWDGEGPRELGRGAAGGPQTHSTSLVPCVAAAGRLLRTSKKPSAPGGALQLLWGKKKAVVVCDKHMEWAVAVKKQKREG